MERPQRSPQGVERTPVPQSRAAADEVVIATYEAHHSEIYAFLARATRDAALAEDLLQETFLRLTGEVRAGRAPQHMRAWLFRVASNLVTSGARRRTTASAWLGRYGPSEHDRLVDESPEAGLLRRQDMSAVEAALARLPADARLALLLAGQGFSGEEVAAAIGRSHGATRTLLCRARLHVRQELAGEVMP